MAQTAGGAYRRHHRQRDRALGDIGGIVADALDVGGDAQGGEHVAQVAGHRRAQRQQAHHVVADFLFQLVDGVVVADHALGRALVAAFDHVDGGFELGHRQFAHAHDLAGEAAQFVVVALDDVFFACAHGDVLCDQPKRPVM